MNEEILKSKNKQKIAVHQDCSILYCLRYSKVLEFDKIERIFDLKKAIIIQDVE